MLALQEVLDDGVTIQTYSTDQGTEYKNRKLDTFLDHNKIRWAAKVG